MLLAMLLAALLAALLAMLLAMLLPVLLLPTVPNLAVSLPLEPDARLIRVLSVV